MSYKVCNGQYIRLLLCNFQVVHKCVNQKHQKGGGGWWGVKGRRGHSYKLQLVRTINSNLGMYSHELICD